LSTIEFSCSLSSPGEPFPHFWEHTVGSDHAPVALRADWQAQLSRCHRELGFRYVRFHGILSDDLGTLVSHKDRLLFSFFNADQIIDYLLSIGMRPFVELSFMPTALASGDKTVFHYRANVTPPRDYAAWEDLVGRLVGHWKDRYGAEEVRRWFFEVWNEPNLEDFWTGTQDDYFRLYRHAAAAIKRADPHFRVGGPATARNEWIPEFLDFCETSGVPADFVSTHHYPTDALGSEDDDTERELSRGRRSRLRDQAREVQKQARGHPVYYTEWNTSSNPRDHLHDEPYAAAFIVKTVMEASGLVEAYSFWTFSDIFEENYAPSLPFHGGFGLLNLHGIAKPSYRAFEILHRLGTRRLGVEGSHGTVDAWVVTRAREVAVLLANHALPRHRIQPERARVRLTNAGEPRSARLERIDADHANARAEWERMGEPEYLGFVDVERLQQVSRMPVEPCPWSYADGIIELELAVPPHAVALATLE
jgi:xylan 1,4-beta-xylosidase